MSGKSTPTRRPEAPADSGAVDTRERYQANYNAFYGNWLGERIGDPVLDATTPERIDGHVADLLESGGSYIGDLAMEHRDESVTPEMAEAFKSQMELAFRDGYGGRFAESDLGENISDFIGSRPGLLLPAGALALGGAYAADVPLEFDTDFGIGSQFTGMLGADFGSAQDIGLDGARAGLEWSNGPTTLGAEGGMRFDEDAWDAALYGSHRWDNGNTLTGRLSHSVTGEDSASRLNLRYHDPGDFVASLNGEHTVTDGEAFSALGGTIRTDWGEQSPWSLSAGAGWDSRRGAYGRGEANYERDNVTFGAFVGADEQSGVNGGLQLGIRF